MDQIGGSVQDQEWAHQKAKRGLFIPIVHRDQNLYPNLKYLMELRWERSEEKADPLYASRHVYSDSEYSELFL